MSDKIKPAPAFIFEDNQIRVRLKNKYPNNKVKFLDKGSEGIDFKDQIGMANHHSLSNFPINDKQYFSIGEMAERLNIAVSKVRFWVESFSLNLSKKNNKGDRFFTRKEADQIEFIAYLLDEKKYTIEGAKKIVHQFTQNQYQKATESILIKKKLENIKDFLTQLRNAL